MSDPIFRLAEYEKRKTTTPYAPPDVQITRTQTQVAPTVYRPPDVIIGERTRIVERLKTEGLIPQEARVTKVMPTKEGYQIEYYTPEMMRKAKEEAKRKYEEERRKYMEQTVSGRILLYGESIEMPDPTGARARGETRYYKDPLEPFRTREWIGGWRTLVGHVGGVAAAFEGLPAFGEMVGRTAVVTVTTGKPQLVQPEVFKFPPAISEVRGKELQTEYMLGQIWGTLASTKVSGWATGKVWTGTKWVASKTAEKVAKVQVPLWLKKVPEAIYYETGLRGAVQYAKPVVTEKAKFLGYVGKEAVREAPFSAFYPLPKLVTKYYVPELAWRISQTTPYMAAKGTVLTAREYLAALKVARQTWTPLSQRIQLSTPYMAGRYVKEIGIPELAWRIKTTTPFMAAKYTGLRARETWAALKVIPQTWTPLRLRIELSMPYATAKYLKQYAIPELLARTKMGVAGLTYYPSEVFKRIGYEAKWYATKEFPTYLGRGLTRLKYGAINIGLDYPYYMVKQKIPQFFKEQAQIAKWYAKEFGYRCLYETKWFVTKEIPTYIQRTAGLIQRPFPDLGAMSRLKMETYYLKEILRRGGYEAVFPIKYRVGLAKTYWGGVKYYLEREIYKTPRGLRHLLKEPYRGMQVTLGRVDLPYRGFMRTVPKGFVVHKTGKGMALLTKQVTKEVVKQPSILKQVAPFAFPSLAQIAKQKKKVKRRQVPSLVAYTGPRFKSIYEQEKKFHQIAGIKMEPLPKEKRKEKEKAVPFGLLRGWEIEKLGQPQLEKQITQQQERQTQSLRQELKQMQTQAVKQAQQQIQKQVPITPYPYFFKREFRRRPKKEKSLFAKWWRKQQKIKTPKQMLKTYFAEDKTLKKVMEVF